METIQPLDLGYNPNAAKQADETVELIELKLNAELDFRVKSSGFSLT